jgi:carboxylesterase
VPVPYRLGTEPYACEGGPVGVVLSHGFTGSPASMRPWAEHLAAAGFAVELPRLPGHGTHWRDLTLTRWPDWYHEIDRAFRRLQGRCDSVFAMGLSMGGTLTTHLAAQHGSDVAGLVLVNPSYRSDNRAVRVLPLAQHVVPHIKGIGNDIALEGADERGYDRVPLRALTSLTQLWRVVESELAQVTQPVLAFRSGQDGVVEDSSLELFRRKVGSTDVTIEQLPRSRHVATLDYDADVIHQHSVAFVHRVLDHGPDPARSHSTGLLDQEVRG